MSTILSLGRLSLTSAPVMTAVVVGATTLYYTDGETVLTLSGGSAWTASTPFDVYGDGSSLYTGPFGGSVVHGGQRVNGAAIGSLAQYAGLYLGAILIDATAGHISCRFGWGSSPGCGIWNFYNQRDIVLRAGGDPTFQVRALAGSGPSTPAWLTIPGGRTNVTVFTGLALDPIEVEFNNAVNTLAPPGGSAWGATAIGWNSTSVPSGFWGEAGLDYGASLPGNGLGPGNTPVARYVAPPSAGVNVATALVWARVIPTASYPAVTTFFGNGEDNVSLTARYRY